MFDSMVSPRGLSIHTKAKVHIDEHLSSFVTDHDEIFLVYATEALAVIFHPAVVGQGGKPSRRDAEKRPKQYPAVANVKTCLPIMSPTPHALTTSIVCPPFTKRLKVPWHRRGYPLGIRWQSGEKRSSCSAYGQYRWSSFA
jgi:hypothetical protein